jgi:hypothetical protein
MRWQRACISGKLSMTRKPADYQAIEGLDAIDTRVFALFSAYTELPTNRE